jgi:uncharacterized protein
MKPERKRPAKRKPGPAAKPRKASQANLAAAEKKSRPLSSTLRSAKKRPPTARSKKLKVPPVLLESDLPVSRSPSGPGTKFTLGPAASPPEASTQLTELPQSYGTGKLWLTARDPHWLYASWDLSPEQWEDCLSRSADRRLVLRVFQKDIQGKPLVEIGLEPGVRHWFIHVGRAGSIYAGQLGYRGKDGKWQTISASAPTITPPNALSEDTSIEFATIPQEISLPQLVEIVKEAAAVDLPLAGAIELLRVEGHKDLPQIPPPPSAKWTPAQARSLAKLVSLDGQRRAWIGSLEITELLRRHIHRQEEAFSIAAAQFSIPPGPAQAPLGISSPGIRVPAARPFWFNLNVELVVYGSTERDAKVSIGKRPIRLRPDGTFSFRFALPDGTYELPVLAQSSDGLQQRSATLKFHRKTELTGEVGAHPQDSSLKPPASENLS